MLILKNNIKKCKTQMIYKGAFKKVPFLYLFFAAAINPLNNGPGLLGLDLNSG